MKARHASWVGSLAVAVGFAGLVAIASEPTGSPSPTAALSPADRYVASVAVDDAVVMLASRGSRLVAVVAWRGPKGWLIAELDETGPDPVAASSSTDGSADIPAFAAAYGRGAPPGGSVEIHWDDSATSTVSVAEDGTWLAARPGEAELARVSVMAPTGEVTVVLPDAREPS